MHSLQNMVRDLSYTNHKKETLNKIQQLLNILNIKDIDILVPALPTPGAGVPKKKSDKDKQPINKKVKKSTKKKSKK